MQQAMRILLTADPEIPVPPLLYGGIERIIDSLIIEFRRLGHQVALAAHRESCVPVDSFFSWPGRSFCFPHRHVSELARLAACDANLPTGDIAQFFAYRLFDSTASFCCAKSHVLSTRAVRWHHLVGQSSFSRHANLHGLLGAHCRSWSTSGRKLEGDSEFHRSK